MENKNSGVYLAAFAESEVDRNSSFLYFFFCRFHEKNYPKKNIYPKKKNKKIPQLIAMSFTPRFSQDLFILIWLNSPPGRIPHIWKEISKWSGQSFSWK